jgi:hypothetical protein
MMTARVYPQVRIVNGRLTYAELPIPPARDFGGSAANYRRVGREFRAQRRREAELLKAANQDLEAALEMIEAGDDHE